MKIYKNNILTIKNKNIIAESKIMDTSCISEEVKDLPTYRKILKREINNMRTNPKSYVEKYKAVIPWFKGKLMRIPGQKVGISTEEGKDSFEDAIEYLKKATPVGKLEYCPALGNVADDYLKAIQDEDPDKISEIDIEEFISQHGEYQGSFRRAIDFGSNNPYLSLMNLFAGDGDNERQQREGIFDDNVKLIAVACGSHKTYRNCNVILTCTVFKPKEGEKDNFPEQANDDNDNNDKNNNNNATPQEGGEDEGEEIEENVKSVKKTSKIVTIKGKKFKITTVVKELEDGTILEDTVKEEM